MKICYIFSNFHLSGITGQPAIIYRLAQAAKERGNQVYIISNSTGDREVFKEGIDYFILNGEGVLKTYITNASRLVAYLGRVKPDIIHVHGYLINAFFRMLNIFSKARYIASICETTEVLAPFYRRIAAFLLNSSHAVIASSEYIKNELVNIGVKRTKLVVARFGLDKKYLDSAQREYLSDTDILYYGDSKKERGFDAILSLARELTDLKFRVLLRWQEEDCRESLEEMQRLPNAEILFYPYKESLESYLLKSKVIVLPYRWMSVRPPLTLIEPMALGRCVVTSLMQGNSEIVKDGLNGATLNFDDVASTAVKIRFLVKDDALRLKMGANARQDIQALYSAEEYAKIFACYSSSQKKHA